MYKKEKHIFPVLDAVLASKKETLDEISKLLGVGRGTVTRKVNGNGDFTFSEVSQISKHFKLPIDFLFSEDAEKFFDAVKTFAEKGISDAVNNFLKKEEVV